MTRGERHRHQGRERGKPQETPADTLRHRALAGSPTEPEPHGPTRSAAGPRSRRSPGLHAPQKELGFSVLAGHGLTYRNIDAIATIPELEELNIGHSAISHALLVGLDSAVREMAALMRNPWRLGR